MSPARVKALPRHSTILPSMWRTHSDLGLAAWRLPLVSAGLQLDGWDVGSHSGASRCGSSLGSPSASLARLSRGTIALQPEDPGIAGPQVAAVVTLPNVPPRLLQVLGGLGLAG